MALRGSAIMVRQFDKMKQLHGIFDDLYSNDMWVSSFATFLNDTISNSETEITPATMLMGTTALIVGQRVLINQSKGDKTDNEYMAELKGGVRRDINDVKPGSTGTPQAPSVPKPGSDLERERLEMEAIARNL